MQMPPQRVVSFLSSLRELSRGDRDRFVAAAPSPQTAIEAVSTAWASRLPLPGVSSGEAELFADPRVDWAIKALGGVNAAKCVELGPLEGGHSYMLEKAGAGSVTAVEANREAYLKCLIVKELLGMRRCLFLCGDVVEYLKATEEKFDVCWCMGILYHMVDPVQLIDLTSQRASQLYMWTHYYDAAKLAVSEHEGRAFANGTPSEATHKGYRHQLHRQDYGGTSGLRGFWGGTRPFSNWLTLEGLMGALEHFGWSEVRTQLDEDHPHGPSVSLVAVRR
ncbi:MAG: class I SAM-dependent methyltransferase [Solirubrobacteraceae bacterium]